MPLFSYIRKVNNLCCKLLSLTKKMHGMLFDGPKLPNDNKG